MHLPILPRPANVTDESGTRGPDMWVDEAIWGHRLYDEQTPWLAFLEFLNVLLSEEAARRAFQEIDGPNTLRYQPHHHLYLRNILFNNPRLLVLLKDVPDDETRWTRWFEDMAHSADGLGEQPDFSYIRSRFTRFEDFVAIVQLLCLSAVEGESNKRWTSKFVFPYGPAALYEDLRVTQHAITNDRRFFGRVGEVVYLMLCRSGRNSELLEQLRPLFLTEETRWNRIVRALIPPHQDSQVRERANAYLPYAILPEFQQFADDWLALLRCRIPGYDVTPYLVDVLGLHVLLYKLRCAQAWATPGKPLRLVLEMVAPRRTTIRDLAAQTYLNNNQMSSEAIKAYIRHTVEDSPEWQAALVSPDPFGNAFSVLRRKVAWPPDSDPNTYDGLRTPEGLLRSSDGLYAAAARRHASHTANVHARYTREIGLASRRSTNRIRYAPNDHIIKSLVLAVVPHRMEFQQFLQVLYDRYSFVIGHRQANVYIEAGHSDQKAFEDNARRLEMRLASLGLLKRLSDACAYVENPYTIQEER
ncbi:MAG: hypothetical protein AB7N91_14650 [Candidatus Tectimicrobiota bacterium]